MTRNLPTRVVAVAAVLLLGAGAARADVVLDWNATMLANVSMNPFGTARVAAITQLAVFEAVNAVTGDYEPYLGTIPSSPGASAEAAAAAAAHGVLIALVPGQATTWNAELTTSLAAIPDGQAKTDGRLLGESVATAMIALRANDGSAPPQSYAPPPPEPGQWQRTGSCSPAGGTNFHWGRLAPFGVPDIAQFRLGPPPALTSGAYAKAYAEVAEVGGADSAMRPQDREDVARFYAAFSPVSWANSAARQIAAAGQVSLAENARAFALLNMAVADASIAVFETKYHYTFWRPETAIRNGETDDNSSTDPDPTFTPLISAPCFPGYPSAHGTLSDAAREVLERLYGPGGHDITFSIAALPGITLDYTDFKRIVEDIADARVYGGIHFRFDQDGGAHQGKDIGKYVYKNNLRPVHPG